MRKLQYLLYGLQPSRCVIATAFSLLTRSLPLKRYSLTCSLPTYSLTCSLTCRCEAELPERLVGGVRLHRFNLKDEKLLLN